MKNERIQKILEGFAGKRILVVGDVMLDRYVQGRVERLNPEAPVPVLHAEEQTDMTGGAGNVAKNVVSLGGTATLIGVVGADDTARELEAVATEEGYTPHLVVDTNRPTTRKIRYVVGAQQLLRVDWEETPDVDTAVTAEIQKHVQTAVDQGIDAIIVSDYAKGSITGELAEALLAIAKEHNLPLAADVKPSRIEYFKGATLIAPNIKEAHEYLGLNHLTQGGRDIAVLAADLYKAFLADVFLTMSAAGVYVYANDGTQQHVPQEHAVTMADTSGAGDTSLAAMMLAKLAGATPLEMAEIANAAGAVVVSNVGAIGVTLEEVQEMLLHKHND